MATENSDLWAVYGRYADEYNRIVKPDWVFSITRYFLHRWVRHLGAGPAWLVVALRQWCYRNKSNGCVVGRAQLGQDIGVHEVTISDFTTKGFAPWFIVESRQNHSYDQRAGRPKQDYNRYMLVMDDPLAPGDFLAVDNLLAEAVAAIDPVPAVQELLQDLLAMPAPALADHLVAVADQILPSAEKQRAGMIETLVARSERTVADLVKIAIGELPAVSAVEMRRLCSELQRKIVNPDDRYTGTHYFRLKWVPLLGHLLAWKVVALRSRCYWNPETGELRDECEVPRKILAEELGCSPKWINQLQKHPGAGLFFRVLNSMKGKTPGYKVQMRESLTPDDQVAFQTLLGQRKQDQANLMGQMAMEFESKESKKGTLATLGKGQKGTLVAEKGTLVTEKGTLATLGSGQKGSLVAEKGTLATHIRLLIDYLCQNRLLIDHQHHADVGNVSDDADAVASLLDLLEIYGRNRARVLNIGLAPDAILAWVLSGLAQPDMGNLAGYVISQLTSVDPAPPPQFWELARLGPEVWELFVAVARGGDQTIPANLRKRFEQWDRLFGSRLREEERQARWREEQACRQAEIAARLQGLDSDDADEAVQISTGIGGSKQVWQAVLSELQLQMTKATFDTWVRDTRLLSCQDGVFVIGAPNEFARDWLENRLLTTVKRTLVGIAGYPVEVQFVLEESPGESREE